MKLPRRKFLHSAAAAAGFQALPRFALAQVYPARPVHIVVGFQGGTASDVIARFVGEWLSERLGQQFVVENRPGAAGNVAAEAVARGVPDGYTLLLVAAVHGGQSVLPIQDSSRFHRLRQGQAGQNCHGLARHRNHSTYRRRVVSDDDRH